MDLNSLGILRSHVARQLRDDRERETFLARIMPEHGPVFQLPHEGMTDTLLQVAVDRNQRLQKLVDKHLVQAPLQQQATAAPGMVTVLELSWKWLFCYGASNRFRLRDKPPGLVWLLGANGAGKTAFQEVLVMAIFGSGIPSRGGSGDARDHVNCRCPEGEAPETTVELECGGRVFRLTRGFGQPASAALLDVTDPSVPVAVAKTLTGVAKWLAQHLGTKEDFLRSVALTQYDDANFFDLDGVRQLELLTDDVQDDQVAHPGVSAGCVDILKAYASSAGALLKCVLAAEDGCKATLASSPTPANPDGASLEELRARRGAVEASIEAKQAQLRDTRDAWYPAVRALGMRDPPSPTTVNVTIDELRAKIQHDANVREQGVRNLNPQQQAQLEPLRRQLAELERQHPYNPQCHACQAQPWRSQARQLRARVDELVSEQQQHNAMQAVELLREQLHKWEALRQALPQCAEYATQLLELQRLKREEADLQLRVEGEKTRLEAARRQLQAEAHVASLRRWADDLAALQEVAAKARLILAGYRCWVLEHRILPSFVQHLNQVLQCFPSERVPTVSVAKLQVSPDVSDLFLPCWRVSDGRVALARDGGFDRCIVNCAARVTLGRMQRNKHRVRVSQLFVDELLRGGDPENTALIPKFLGNLASRMGYRHLVCSCHSLQAGGGSVAAVVEDVCGDASLNF